MAITIENISNCFFLTGCADNCDWSFPLISITLSYTGWGHTDDVELLKTHIYNMVHLVLPDKKEVTIEAKPWLLVNWICDHL